MSDPYGIKVDWSRRLISISLTGQWSGETIDAYKRDLSRCVRSVPPANAGGSGFLLMIDLRNHGVQTKEVAAELQEMIADFSPLSRRTALILSPSNIHRMQVKRISPLAERRIFSKESEALAWLLQ